ncbi:hypothetical protein [Alienimonas californiensis]|uniref:Uncharacterized protein n=1 Tax=Alienimonas californiensis TaxID=2527989 RepID=A0A517PEI5_9PLAN|nr:hypothetical protein [Alienimonas californiensis]QDT17778.1 hypothetical protein CA12_39110 [Alienimonas californiensis]
MTSRPNPRLRRAPAPVLPTIVRPTIVRPTNVRPRLLAGLLSAALGAVLAPTAPAQFYDSGYGGGSGCGCSTASASPSYYSSYSTASYAPASYASAYGGSYTTVDSCTPIYQTAAVECVPVQQVQTVAICEPPKMVAVPRQVTDRVPVTKYVSVQETVKRPRTVTRYEEREFTEMMPQTETRTAMAQQVNYRPVANTQTVVKDAGYWQTRRIANPKMSPCQYDPRPGFAGSLNRFGYNVRSAFTPKYTTQRQYVPQQMACNVTTHSQVAEVTNVPQTYQVTTMVPVIKKRQVAVQEVVWEDQQVTAMKPVTEYQERSRTVYNYLPSTDPVAVAYLSGRGTTATALRPETDSGFDSVPTRSADASSEKYKRDEAKDFDDTKTSYNLPSRGSRRVSRPVHDPAPKVRMLTDADRERLAALKLAARSRGANDERMAARPTIAAPPAGKSEPVRRPAADTATTASDAPTLIGAAGRVPQVDAARRWEAAGPALPIVALTSHAL